MPRSASDLFIVDNSDQDWKVLAYLEEWCELSKAIDIATGHFEISSLLSLKEKWQGVDKIRILWNFRMGGYQVLAQWMEHREGRELTADDIAHYQKVIVAIAEPFV